MQAAAQTACDQGGSVLLFLASMHGHVARHDRHYQGRARNISNIIFCPSLNARSLTSISVLLDYLHTRARGEEGGREEQEQEQEQEQEPEYAAISTRADTIANFKQRECRPLTADLSGTPLRTAARTLPTTIRVHANQNVPASIQKKTHKKKGGKATCYIHRQHEEYRAHSSAEEWGKQPISELSMQQQLLLRWPRWLIAV